MGIVYLLKDFNFRTPVYRGVVTHKHPFEGFAAAFLQLRFENMFRRIDNPTRFTVVTDEGDTLEVFGLGPEAAVNDTLYFVREESMFGSIIHVRVK